MHPLHRRSHSTKSFLRSSGAKRAGPPAYLKQRSANTYEPRSRAVTYERDCFSDTELKDAALTLSLHPSFFSKSTNGEDDSESHDVVSPNLGVTPDMLLISLSNLSNKAVKDLQPQATPLTDIVDEIDENNEVDDGGSLIFVRSGKAALNLPPTPLSIVPAYSDDPVEVQDVDSEIVVTPVARRQQSHRSHRSQPSQRSSIRGRVSAVSSNGSQIQVSLQSILFNIDVHIQERIEVARSEFEYVKREFRQSRSRALSLR